MGSFVDVAPESHFPLQNLPYGIFSSDADPTSRPGVAIGSQVVDLRALSRAGLFSGPELTGCTCFEEPALNAFMALGRPAWAEARATLQRLLSAREGELQDNEALRAAALVPQSAARMHLPAAIGDYTDFYCSLEHATNCGVMFRGKEQPLNPNWRHLPVAYHGRASSIVVSGTDVRRPWGQVLRAAGQPPEFRPSGVLDFELEMGCFVGPGNKLGHPIPLAQAADHLFGFVLLNDWSARDIQRWEYVPLGPFNSKNWATSISPWVVTLDALEPFKVAAPPQEPPPLPHLCPPPPQALHNYSVRLEVSLLPGDRAGAGSMPGPGAAAETVVARSNMQSLYWTLPQMAAHHTAGGCNLRPGDLLGTGTLSVEGAGGQGSMLELSWNGSRSVALDGGEGRTFLEDWDRVTLRGYCQGEGYRVGFGECTGRVLPAYTRPAV